MRRLAAIITAGAVTLVACSGDESATTTTPSTVTATSPATTTSSTTTTTSTTTTIPPTTTTTTTVPLDVEIQAALDSFVDALLTCLEAPATCDRSFVAARSSAADTVSRLIQQFVDGDRYLSSDRRGTYMRVQSIERDSPTRAVASVCWYDAASQLGPVGPDGQPTVFNDRITSRLLDITMENVDGRWLASELSESEVIAEDADACAE